MAGEGSTPTIPGGRSASSSGSRPPRRRTATVPSSAYLMAHPAALKAAEKACNEGSGSGIVSLCDRVHSAEARLMAEKYHSGADAAPPPRH